MLWFLRMAKWAKNPPSERRVKFVFAIIGICLSLVAIEWLFGFPEWLLPNSEPGRRFIR